MHEIETQLQRLGSAPAGDAPDTGAVIRRYRTARRRKYAALGAVVVAGGVAGVVVSLPNHSAAPPALNGTAPGCLPPQLTIASSSVDPTSQVPSLTVKAGSDLALTVQQVAAGPNDPSISGLSVALSSPGAPMSTANLLGVLPDAALKSAQNVTVGAKIDLGPLALATGTYPIVATYHYRYPSGPCSGGGLGTTTGVVGYVTIN